MANPSQRTLVFATFGKWTFPGKKRSSLPDFTSYLKVEIHSYGNKIEILLPLLVAFKVQVLTCLS